MLLEMPSLLLLTVIGNIAKVKMSSYPSAIAAEIQGNPSSRLKYLKLMSIRNNWGASAIDALSTALIMEIQPIVTEILDYTPNVDFTTTATGVSLFETTIRYLAGMLSAYDLLQGPLSHLSPGDSIVESLLAQSKVLADSLKFAFETPTGIPANNIFFATHSTDGSTSNGLATIGSLQLEWQRLSDLTGDPTYGSLAQKAETYLLHPEPNWAEPFPGLVGTRVNIDTGEFLDATVGSSSLREHKNI